MSKEERLAKNIFEYIGGKQNTNKIYNCMTRIRIDIKDFQAVNLSALEEEEGILGIVKDDNTLQIVVGPGISQKVADEMHELSGISHTERIDENLDPHLTSNRSHSEEIANQNKKKINLRILNLLLVP